MNNANFAADRKAALAARRAIRQAVLSAARPARAEGPTAGGYNGWATRPDGERVLVFIPSR